METSKTIYRYQSNAPLYALGFDQNPNDEFRLAIGSFIEHQNNKIDIIARQNDQLHLVNTIPHIYPPTKIIWSPASAQNRLLATISDNVKL